MRVRTTWDPAQIKQAAMNRQADPYTINQDRKQPAADQYVNGNPSTWAEDPHPASGTWEAEYANGQVKRNEVGLPEMRGDTFNHPDKTASELLVRHAALAEKTARLMLKSKKTASEDAIEDQAFALMQLSPEQLTSTYVRLANDEKPWEQGQEQDKQAQEQGQQAQDQGKQAQQQGQQGQEQGKQAAPVAAPAAAALTLQDVEKVVQASLKSAMDQMFQQAQQQAQLAQQQAQAQQQQMAQQQAQQQMAQQQMAQQQAQQQMAQQQQAPMADQGVELSEQQMIDDMMAQEQPAADPVAEMGIDLSPAPMDDAGVELGPEDEVLMSLFANQEVQNAQLAKQAEEQAQQGQAQGKQASVRTASRTIGTRPTAGVSRVGGVGTPHTASAGVSLSQLWASAPDVSDAFR